VSKKSEKKGDKEYKGKDGQLIIRINKAEKDRFVSLCDELDTSAAREIRHFIRRYLKEHE
jgi:hypothetical protein